MATYGKLEHQITVPTGGWDTTVGGVTATIPAGTYYLSSPGGRSSDFLAEVATQFAAAASASCTCTASLGEAGTGIVTITFGSAKTIAWVDTEVRDILGFDEDSASATSHVSTLAARGCWMPTTAFWTKNGGGDWRGRVRADYRSSANAAGHVFAAMGQKRYELELRWGAVKRERMWITSESVANQSLERFWRDGIWGEASWGTPGGPVRWYPDAAADTVYGTYRVIDADLYDPAQAVTDYVGSWAVQMPLMIQVPGTEELGVSSAREVIGVTQLTSDATTTDAASFNTASIDPSDNALVLAWVASRRAGPAAPTLTGNGLTWVQVATSTDADTAMRLTVFRALGASPSAGAVTIDFGATSQTSCAWSICELTNVNTSGTNGSGALVQSVTDTEEAVTSITATLAALENAANVNVTGVIIQANASVTPDADFTELADEGITSNPFTLEVQWALNQIACTPTFSSNDACIISVEVKAST